MAWTLKLTYPDKPNDYLVLDETGKSLGRIYSGKSMAKETWWWFLNVEGEQQPHRDRWTADSLSEAKNDFAEAWERAVRDGRVKE